MNTRKNILFLIIDSVHDKHLLAPPLGAFRPVLGLAVAQAAQFPPAIFPRWHPNAFNDPACDA